MAQFNICITYKKNKNANIRDDVCATHHFAYNGNNKNRATANRSTVKRLCFGFAFGNVEPVNDKHKYRSNMVKSGSGKTELAFENE